MIYLIIRLWLTIFGPPCMLRPPGGRKRTEVAPWPQQSTGIGVPHAAELTVGRARSRDLHQHPKLLQ